MENGNGRNDLRGDQIKTWMGEIAISHDGIKYKKIILNVSMQAAIYLY